MSSTVQEIVQYGADVQDPSQKRASFPIIERPLYYLTVPSKTLFEL